MNQHDIITQEIIKYFYSFKNPIFEIVKLINDNIIKVNELIEQYKQEVAHKLLNGEEYKKVTISFDELTFEENDDMKRILSLFYHSEHPISDYDISKYFLFYVMYYYDFEYNHISVILERSDTPNKYKINFNFEYDLTNTLNLKKGMPTDIGDIIKSIEKYNKQYKVTI